MKYGLMKPTKCQRCQDFDDHQAWIGCVPFLKAMDNLLLQFTGLFPDRPMGKTTWSKCNLSSWKLGENLRKLWVFNIQISRGNFWLKWSCFRIRQNSTYKSPLSSRSFQPAEWQVFSLAILWVTELLWRVTELQSDQMSFTVPLGSLGSLFICYPPGN